MFEVFNVQVNILAIILATVAVIVIGMLWYSPVLFGNYWLKLIGKKKEELTMKSTDMVYATIVALLTVVGINSILQFSMKVTGLSELVNVILVAFMTSITISATTELNLVIWEGRSKKLFLLNLAHHFVEYLAIGFILAIFI
jgi:hypothetical protein